jgi:hypothetical protein
MLRLVEMENPPLRVLFGRGLVSAVETEYNNRIELWKKFEDIAEEAAGAVTT